MRNPNCNKCQHFYITIDEKRPYACRVFNIKCPGSPSVEVRRVTGHICPVFSPKLNKSKQKISTIKENTNFDTFA